MRPTPNLAVERYRVRDGPLASSRHDGNNGAFAIRVASGMLLSVIASDGDGWDHVSVSTPTRCPTWEEMCLVKEMFFADEEVVMQLHPALSEYRNLHPYCLHLWRPQDAAIPLPPPGAVAPAGLKTLVPRFPQGV